MFIDINTIYNLQKLGIAEITIFGFVQEVPNLLKAIEKALELDDKKDLERLFNQLKAKARQLGAIKLSNICWNAEELVKSEQYNSIAMDALTSSIQQEVKYVVNALGVMKARLAV
jgi:HPt (histidine-containing phosphotransfer) domain-containing protein